MKFKFSKKDKAPPNKKFILIAVIIAIILVLVFLIFSGGKKEGQIIENFSNNNVVEENSTAIKPPPPPPLVFDEKKVQEFLKESEDANTTSDSNNTVGIESLNKGENINQSSEELKIPAKEYIEEKTQELATQKDIQPVDMADYLQKQREHFKFDPKNVNFEFEGKKYTKGERFKGWLIEDITSNYIRFMDEDKAYSYNLRFFVKEN